jgi:hypothetical protein
MRLRLKLSSIALVAISLFSFVHSQTEDVDSEIRRLRKELMQVQEERRRVSDDSKKDKEEFETYRKRILERMRSARAETDSTKKNLIQVTLSRDSVDAMINAEKNNARRYELLQDEYRLVMINACDTVSAYASKMPPLVSGRLLSAIKLLRDELTASTIDNVESTGRLGQIIKDMHEQGGTIQIVQGNSPVPEIRGTSYSIRIGSIYEALVNAQGSQAAVWEGYDESGQPKWKNIQDAIAAQEILRAVNVREGKSLPVLVNIPMYDINISKVE